MPAALPPVDQCKGDPGFTAFRANLVRIVSRRDKKAFLALLAPDVLVNFGGANGPKAFEEQWNFDEPDDPDGVWAVTGLLLKLGCARDGAVRQIPSLGVQLGAYVDELTDEIAMILPGARLYKEAGVPASKPQTTPWTLGIVTSQAGDLFTGVRLPDGREGLVGDTDIYEPTGYRMTIEKRRGKWMITAFVAGD